MRFEWSSFRRRLQPFLCSFAKNCANLVHRWLDPRENFQRSQPSEVRRDLLFELSLQHRPLMKRNVAQSRANVGLGHIESAELCEFFLRQLPLRTRVSLLFLPQ